MVPASVCYCFRFFSLLFSFMTWQKNKKFSFFTFFQEFLFISKFSYVLFYILLLTSHSSANVHQNRFANFFYFCFSLWSFTPVYSAFYTSLTVFRKLFFFILFEQHFLWHFYWISEWLQLIPWLLIINFVILNSISTVLNQWVWPAIFKFFLNFY